ncbi:MAG: TIGR00730 family Rossman fold protein [Anaerovoracaceae bacterium]
MRICVFGASADVDEKYKKAVRALARRLGEKGCSMVFGGFRAGLMAASAEGFRDAGAEITGVTPAILESSRDVFPGCTEVIKTGSLSERKDRMIEMADAFLVLPGGIGTLDELFQVLAMNVIGESAKPVIIYNFEGFYDGIISALDGMWDEGFLYKKTSDLFTVVKDLKDIDDLDFLK